MKSANTDYATIVENCIANLQAENGDAEALSNTIFSKMIIDIFLGSSSFVRRLSTLNKIFESRHLLVHDNVDENIKGAYEGLVKQTKIQTIKDNINKKIAELS